MASRNLPELMKKSMGQKTANFLKLTLFPTGRCKTEVKKYKKKKQDNTYRAIYSFSYFLIPNGYSKMGAEIRKI